MRGIEAKDRAAGRQWMPAVPLSARSRLISRPLQKSGVWEIGRIARVGTVL